MIRFRRYCIDSVGGIDGQSRLKMVSSQLVVMTKLRPVSEKPKAKLALAVVAGGNFQ